MMGGEGVLIEVAFVVGSDDDVKRMACALGVGLRGGAGIVRDAVPSAWYQVAAVAQGYEFGIGDGHCQLGGCTAATVATFV